MQRLALGLLLMCALAFAGTRTATPTGWVATGIVTLPTGYSPDPFQVETSEDGQTVTAETKFPGVPLTYDETTGTYRATVIPPGPNGAPNPAQRHVIWFKDLGEGGYELGFTIYEVPDPANPENGAWIPLGGLWEEGTLS